MLARTLLAISLLLAAAYPVVAQPHVPNTTWTDPNGKIHVYGDDGSEPWYEGTSKPQTLKEAFVAEKGFLGANNVGYHMMGNQRVCAALKAVKLPCDYNTRGTLSMFLTVNGKGLFPASGGTNPYFTVADREADAKLGILDDFPDDGFIGHPPQNDMLAAAITKNAKLFHNGDLTAADVQRNWR